MVIQTTAGAGQEDRDPTAAVGITSHDGRGPRSFRDPTLSRRVRSGNDPCRSWHDLWTALLLLRTLWIANAVPAPPVPGWRYRTGAQSRDHDRTFGSVPKFRTSAG